jgi:hypothetical protein
MEPSKASPSWRSKLYELLRKPLAIIGAIIIAALTAGIAAWVTHYAGPPQEKPKAALAVEFRRFFGDYPSTLQSWGGDRALLPTLWEVTISNHGELTDTIVGYHVLMAASDGTESYSGLDQGLFDQHLTRLDLPLSVEPQHAARFFVKLGILVPASVYQHILTTFQPGPVASVEAIYKKLYRDGTDIHGLPVLPIAESGFTFPKASSAPSFAIAFDSLSGRPIREVASWYPRPE